MQRLNKRINISMDHLGEQQKDSYLNW